MYSRDALYAMWQHLEDAVREGTHRWGQTFGLEGPIFSHFFRTDEAMRHFLMGMHGFGMISSPKVAAAFDLSRFRRLVDLGGATGHLVMACCERYPDLHGVIYDLPRAAPLARELAAQSPAAARIEIVSGDFFQDELPPADLYSLGQILHDWREDQIAILLHRIWLALPADGAVLIAERLMNDDGVGPLGGNMQSLGMLVCTEGKERTAAGYETLLRAAGFRSVEARRTGVRLDAVLAVK
jgi:acetylserotonin N-methyltransferase